MKCAAAIWVSQGVTWPWYQGGPITSNTFFVSFGRYARVKLCKPFGCRTLLDFFGRGRSREKTWDKMVSETRQKEATDWFIAHVKKDENEK
jgi:predicted RNA-binding Zn ribbon-like protein